MAVTASDESASVAGLLRAYDEALRTADELPPVVWMRSRPPGDTPLSRWIRMPRCTLGTSTIVRIHITRSVDSLLRLHARAAALEGAEAARERDRKALETFRASIRPVPIRLIVLAALAAAAVIGRSLVELVGGSIDFIANQLDDNDLAALRRLADALTTVATSLSASSLTEVTRGLLTEDPRVVVIALTTALATIYLVLRPLSPAFRVKRTLFNLAGHGTTTLAETPTTWHVARSTGLYERERAVFTALGGRPPGEIPVDLLLSGAVAVIVIAPLVLLQGRAEVAVVVVPALLRMAWLVRTYRDRRRLGGETRRLPEYVALPATGRVVDARDPIEVVGLVLAYVLLPVAWFRVSLHQDHLLRELDAQEGHLRPPPSRWQMVARLASATFFYVVGPFVCTARSVRLLRRPRLRSDWAAWAVAAATVGLFASLAVFARYEPGSGPGGEDPLGFTIGAFLFYALLAAVVAAMQLVNNHLVRRLGDPLPFGVPSHQPTAVVFNPPPAWPPPPEGWSPTPPWDADPAWEPVPSDWRLWVPSPRAPDLESADPRVGP